MGDPVRPDKSRASPGFFGALKDLVSSVSNAAAPKSITERRGRIDSAVDDMSGEDSLDARRRAQHSDHNN